MADKKIRGITIEIGGNTAGLSKALKDVEDNCNKAKNELRDVDRALKNAPDSAILWKQKQELLTQAFEASKKKLDSLITSQKSLSQKLADGDIDQNAYDTFKNKIENARKNLNNLLDTQKDVEKQLANGEIDNGEYEKFTKKVESATKKLSELESSEKSFEERVKIGDISEEQYRSFQREIEKTRSQAQELESQLEKINNSVKSEESTEDIKALGNACKDSADKAEKSSSGGFSALNIAIGNLASDGIKSALDGLKNLATESDNALSILRTKINGTKEQISAYNDSVNKLYKSGMGEDRSDIANTIADVKNQLGDIDSSSLENAAKDAILLRDSFDMGIDESLRASKMLMLQFGVTSNEAYTLIAQGAQDGLNKNGDLLDVINEYSVHYKQQGYSAEEFFNSLKNGTDSGTFSVDKLGDAMKEFGIRSKDTAQTTTEGFSIIGLNADEMRSKFAAGGDSARGATQETIDALFNLNDEVKRNQAGVDLFGTMWEDLQEKGIKALTDVDGQANKSADTLKKMSSVKYDSLQSQITSISRSVKSEIFEPIVEKLMPKVKDGTDWIIKNIPKIKENAIDLLPTVEAIGIGFATWKAVSSLQSGIAIVKNFVAVLQEGNTAMKALNITMGLNPAGAVAIAVAGLATAIGILIATHKDSKSSTEKAIEAEENNVKKIREERDAYNEKIKAAQDGAATEETQVVNAQNLWNELDTLADSTGKVEDKDKERAQFILGQLNNALGTEYSMTGNQINQYDALKSSIDDMIESKKASILLNNYESVYTEALTKKTEAEAEQVQKQIEINNQRVKVSSIKRADGGTFTEQDYKDYTEKGLWTNDANFDNWLEQRQLLAEKEKSYNENEKSLKQYYADIKEYEDASTAILQKNYEKAVQILDSKGKAFKKADQLLGESTQEQKAQLEKQVEYYQTNLSIMQQRYKDGTDGVTRQMVESAAEQLATAEREYGKLGYTVSDSIKPGLDNLGYNMDVSVNSVSAKSSDITDAFHNVTQQIIDDSWTISDRLHGTFDEDYTSGFVEKMQNVLSPIANMFKGSFGGGFSFNLPAMAAGGTLNYGSAIVAEAGPELISIMNGGVQVTPLTPTAKNMALSQNSGSATNNYYNNVYATVSSEYDVSKLAYELSAYNRQIQAGKGK